MTKNPDCLARNQVIVGHTGSSLLGMGAKLLLSRFALAIFWRSIGSLVLKLGALQQHDLYLTRLTTP